MHVEALSTDQFLRGVERLCWGSVRLDVGHAFGWPGFLGAMVWLGRASLKPSSGKLCFHSFPGALVHVEMLELCPAGCGLCFRLAWASWSYDLAGPGFLETMLWQALFS